MARIRTIKPEFFSSEDMASVSPHARLLAIALLQLADAEGRFRWVPMQVHAHAFPWEPDLDLRALTDELTKIEYLTLYEVEGKSYASIPGFVAHQRLSGKEAGTKSLHPAPPTGNDQGKSTSFPGKHLDAQERERERERGKGKGSEVSARSRAPHVASLHREEPDDPLTTIDPITLASVRGLYGRPDGTGGWVEGTDARVWGTTPSGEREALLTTALLRWRSEGHSRFQARFFRAIVASVVAERDGPATGGTGGWTDEDEARWQRVGDGAA